MDAFDEPIRDPEVLARAQMTFDLCDTAEQIMRQNIRRRHPELNESEVEERFAAWFRSRRKDDAYGRPSAKWARKLGLRQ